jgi:hypothetical protein
MSVIKKFQSIATDLMADKGAILRITSLPDLPVSVDAGRRENGCVVHDEDGHLIIIDRSGKESLASHHDLPRKACKTPLLCMT